MRLLTFNCKAPFPNEKFLYYYYYYCESTRDPQKIQPLTSVGIYGEIYLTNVDEFNWRTREKFAVIYYKNAPKNYGTQKQAHAYSVVSNFDKQRFSAYEAEQLFEFMYYLKHEYSLLMSFLRLYKGLSKINWTMLALFKSSSDLEGLFLANVLNWTSDCTPIEQLVIFRWNSTKNVFRIAAV